MSGFGVDTTYEYNEWEINSGTAGNILYPDTSRAAFVRGSRPIRNIAAFKAIEVSIPFSYYVFWAAGENGVGNNTFLLDDGAPGSPTTVTITPGNYSASQMATELGVRLTAASSAAVSYTVSFNDRTGSFVITASAGNFSLIFNDNPLFLVDGRDIGQTTPRRWLGFNAGTITSSASVLVAPNAAQLSGPNFLYLCSLALGGLNNDTLYINSQEGSGPVIAKIPVTVNPGGIITWQEVQVNHLFDINHSTVVNSDFSIQWGDFSNPSFVDLRGQAFDAKLEFLTDQRTVSTGVSGSASRFAQAGPL